MIATARRVEDLADLAAAGCRTLPLDVTDEASMRAAVDAIEAAHGRIDVLVNNAGYSQSGAVESVPLARTRAQFETNVFGPLRLTQLVLPGMRRRRAGRIVNVSSMGGRLVFPGGGVYHASKYAVEALSDALRYELRPFGIAVVLIEPGLIRTNFAATVGAKLSTLTADADGAAAGRGRRCRLRRVQRRRRPRHRRGLRDAARWRAWPASRSTSRAPSRGPSRRRVRAPATPSPPSATFFLTLRRWLGDAGWDWFLRSNFGAPKPPRGGLGARGVPGVNSGAASDQGPMAGATPWP